MREQILISIKNEEKCIGTKYKVFKLQGRYFPINQVKKLLKTFKKSDSWLAYINQENNLKIEYQCGESQGSMTFYGYN